MILKTLKDMDLNSIIKNGLIAEDSIEEQIKFYLKNEAIKWIKERILFCTYCLFPVSRNEICDEHKFWMERFNITEEDLND